MQTPDHRPATPSQEWAPNPEEFNRLQAEATEAVTQAASGQLITDEQGDLILWACSPLPELFPPAHLKG